MTSFRNMLNTLLFICGIFLSGFVSLAQPAHDKTGFEQHKQIKAMLEKPTDKLDLARIKLTIDKMIDPTIEVEKTLAAIETMVSEIKGMVRADAPKYG